MAKNFLFFSPSFLSQIKKGKKGERYRKIWEHVFENSDDKYKMKMKISDFTAQLNEKLDCNYSDESYRRYFVIINNAREFLLDKDLDKIPVFLSEYSEILQSGDRYRSLIYSGVFCLIQDGITTWEKVEELLNAKKSAGSMPVVVLGESTTKGSDTVNETKEPDTFLQLFESLKSEYILINNKLHDKTNEAIEYRRNYEDLQIEIRECLDELKNSQNYRNANSELQQKLSELKAENDRLQKIIEDLKKDKKNAETLIESLKKENEEIKKIDISTIYQMLSDHLKIIPTTSIAIPKIDDVKQKKDEKNILNNGLPELYRPNNTKVVYTDYFMEQYNKFDKSVTPKLLKKIKSICRNGVKSVAPRDIHTITKGLNGAPDNSTQVTVRKLRIVLKESCGVLSLYDVFFKKNSPNGNK